MPTSQEQILNLAYEISRLNKRLQYTERRVRAVRAQNFVNQFKPGDLGEFGDVSTFLDFKEVAVPDDPDSGWRRVFANTATNKLSVRTSSSTTINLEYGDTEAIAAIEGEATLDLTGDVTITGAGKSLEVINFKFETATELTISSGDIAVTQAYHRVDTESDAGTDNLDGITGGADGEFLLLRPENDARTIVVRHNQNAANVKNILLAGGTTATLDDISDMLLLFYDATLDTNGAWVEVARTVPPSATHNILDGGTVHTDTASDGVTEGSLIIGNNTPAWDELVISVPAANVRNVLGVDNGETTASWKTALDATNPAAVANAAAAGTSLVFSHRDHVHKMGVITTKGDLLSWSTVPARLGVGANDTILMAASGQTTGLVWTARSGTAQLADIADSEAAGSDTTIPYGDHVHAHPSGLTANLHHNPVTVNVPLALSTQDLSLGIDTTTLEVDGFNNLSVKSDHHASKTANLIFAGPASGAPAAPTFRSMVAADLVAHGPAAHTTGYGTWKLIYTDASGDQQEIAVGADGTVFTGTGVGAAPEFGAADDHAHTSQASLTSIQSLTVTLADAGANAIFGWDDTAAAYENLTKAEALAVLNVADGADVTGSNAPQAHAAAEHSAVNIIPDANQAYTGDMGITGALTATSHGGITEANLVDKSAAETIGGAWVFPQAITDNAVLTVDGAPNDTEHAVFNADGLEGLTDAELLVALSGDADAAFDWGGQDLTNIGVIFLTEQAAAEADVADKGQIWVKTGAPNTLWWTDEDGTDTQLGVAGGGHAMLSATHTDSVANAVTAGSIVIGNDTPAWDELVIAIPAANVRNVLGIDNAETTPTWKTALDGNDPAAVGAAASPGTSLVFSHRDHVHAREHAKYTGAEAVTAVEAEDPLTLAGVVQLAKYMELDEIADPGGGAANVLRLYAVDVGGTTGLQITDSAAVDTTIIARERVFDISLGAFLSHTGAPGHGIVDGCPVWAFDDAAADESIMATMVVPSDYVSGAKIRLYYFMDTAAAGDVAWVTFTLPLIEGETVSGAGTVDSVADTVQGTNVHLGVVDITLTLTVVAGDWLKVRVRRSGSHASDTATGDAYLTGCAFVYTAFF